MTITEKDIFELDDSYIGEEIYVSDYKNNLVRNVNNKDTFYKKTLHKIRPSETYRYQALGAAWKYAYPVNGKHNVNNLTVASESNLTIYALSTIKKTAILCKTREEYDYLMLLFEKAGRMIYETMKPTEWNVYKEYDDGFCVNVGLEKSLGYCNKDWYIKEGYKVITLQDYLNINACNSEKTETGTIKKIMTNFKSIIKELTRTEPQKTYILAGFMDKDENITETGKEALESILIKVHEKELLALAQQVNEYNESKKK